MKPLMNRSVILNSPLIDEYGKEIRDDRDRPVTESVSYIGRVQRKTRTHRGPGGQTFETSLEVDLPPAARLTKSMTGYFDVIGEGMVKGTVREFEGIPNLSGSRVDYWTVFVDG